MRAKQPLDVAIVGLAHLHPPLYLPTFQSLPAFRVIAAVDPDPQILRPFCEEFGLKPFPSLEDLLAEQEPDVAAIFLPHAACPEAAEVCARAGVHLMIEKPMAAHTEGARRIVETAARNGVKLTTGYCWRLHPAARAFKQLIADGAVGRPVAAEGRCAAGRLQRYLDGHAAWMLDPRQSGGGPMLNLGVHWIDFFRWVLQDEVTEVSARNARVNTRYEIEDNSFAHLRFAQGTLAALDISYTVPDAFPHGRDLYVAVRGTAGVLSWAPAYEGECDVLTVCSDDNAFRGAANRQITFQLDPVPGYSGYMGREYVRAFARSVLEGGEPPVTGQDGLAALQVVEAVYQADRERRWVPVPD